MSIRDRDIAAEIMGSTSSHGCCWLSASLARRDCRALLASFVTRELPERWDLFLSVQFIAIILIGGAGTVAGVILGSAFVVLAAQGRPGFHSCSSPWLWKEGIGSAIANVFVATTPNDFGLVNTFAGVGPGLSVAQLNLVLYGLLIIGFLIFEPLGLFGIWLRIRNYWKGWPFTY